MDFRKNPFEAFHFTKKEEYTEEECQKYFSSLEEGIYTIPSVGWVIKIQDRGAFFIDKVDKIALDELMADESMPKEKTTPSEILELFGKKPYFVHLSMDAVQHQIEMILRNPSSLDHFHPNQN
jgi:hypothetical protein